MIADVAPWVSVAVSVVNLIALPLGIFKYVIALESRLARIEATLDVKKAG